MSSHPWSGVVIAAAHNTRQARRLPGETSLSMTIEAAEGLAADTGLDLVEVDGILSKRSAALVYELGLAPAWVGPGGGITAILDAIALVAAGVCECVLVAEGEAATYLDAASTAPWTRPDNEFVVPFGMFTAVEFALVARRHMEQFGTTHEQMAHVAATIRNNGHVNPEAVYHGRGPFSVEDVMASRPVAEPFHLLDCSTTSEGGCAVLVTTQARAANLAVEPVVPLGGARDQLGPSYQHPPRWDLEARGSEHPNGYIGRRAARHAFAMAGLGPDDVDVCELYDPFSFEIIRQYEAFGFCPDGSGGPFVAGGNADPGGRFPVTTDGGTMSFSHGGGLVQMLQRVVRAVHQVQGVCATRQVSDAEVALCSNGGAGALFCDVLILGAGR